MTKHIIAWSPKKDSPTETLADIFINSNLYIYIYA